MLFVNVVADSNRVSKQLYANLKGSKKYENPASTHTHTHKHIYI